MGGPPKVLFLTPDCYDLLNDLKNKDIPFEFLNGLTAPGEHPTIEYSFEIKD
ncbi:MAG: hypothetical protein RLN81_14015 [Balneolaceae bacterium]